MFYALGFIGGFNDCGNSVMSDYIMSEFKRDKI